MKEGKKLYSGMSGWAWLLTGALVFSSCTEDEMMENNNFAKGDGIRFGITQTDNGWEADSRSAQTEKEFLLRGEQDSDTMRVSVLVKDGILPKTPVTPSSRGAQATSANSFNVAAYYYTNADASGVSYFNETVSDGVNTTGGTYYWPQTGTLDFLAISPSDGDRTLPTAAAYDGGQATITYEVPATVAEQQDLMVAVSKDLNNNSNGEAVPLTFEHLLAAVQFKVGTMQFIKINSLTVSGLQGGTLTFTYDKANDQWTCTNHTDNNASYSPIVDDTSGMTTGDEVTSNASNSIMLVMPQTTTESTTLTVNYTALLTGDTETKTVSIKEHTWEAGKTTVYVLHIGTTFDVEIPRPSDQDAHYIMLKMPYKMGALSDYVTSLKATVQWAKDETGNDISNNSSSKTSISLLFEENLSETQKQGFWTDAKYVETITVSSSNGTATSSGISKQADIRGGSELTISGDKLSEGTIVLFIEENNGTTDRTGELLFTATLTDGSKVVIGRGTFKQLCPSWNTNGIGVERIEDKDTDGNVLKHPYGFDYSRTVVFTNPGHEDYVLSETLRCLINSWIINSSITDDEGDFITLNKVEKKFLYIFTVSYIETITLNYGALSEVSDVANDDDGLENTRALYNFTGGNDLSTVETNLVNNSGWNYKITETGDIPDDYAAYVALSRNRMYELETTVKANGEEDAVSYKAVLYKDDDEKDIIEWYLPSSEEAKTLVETGAEENGISPLNGTYWSSTAGDDADAYAHSYTYTDNTFTSINESEARMTNHKVRAVRKKP